MEGDIEQPRTAVEEELRPRALEERKVLVWRFAQSRRLGLSHVEARLFAESGADLGQLRDLVARGCAAALALRIVL